MNVSSVIIPGNYDYVIQTRYLFRTEYIFIQDLKMDSYLKACKQI